MNSAKPNDALSAMGLQGKGPVVLIGFTMLRTSERGVWIEAVRAFMRALPEARFLIRLHPADCREYPELLVGFEGRAAIAKRELALEEVLSRADVTVVDSSTLGFDALLRNHLVAVLDPYAMPKMQDFMRDAVQLGAVLYFRDPAQLAGALKKMLGDPAQQAALRSEARALVQDYVAAWGQDAARQIATTLKAAAIRS